MPTFPRAAMCASREELHALPLVAAPDSGPLPAGLAGHLFILSTCGSVDSGGAPYPDGNDRPTVINGDGMVWRFDLAPPGGGPPIVSSAIVKPPDYHWDALTRRGSPLEWFGFVDAGILRVSTFLGTRNFANTALVPLPPAPDDPAAATTPPRLLCCYDAGPPVEIDPATLRTKAVVGERWDPEALDGLWPFPPILATAHPFYDPSTRELFAVNYGRTGASLLETIPLVERLAYLPERAWGAIGRLADGLGRLSLPARLVASAKAQIRRLMRLRDAHKGRRESALPQSFLDLVWWDGTGDILRLNVFDEATGERAAVVESMHQVAATRRYVLLLDTNFKLRLDQTWDNPLVDVAAFERLVRDAVASQQGVVSNLWVIERAAIAHARASGLRNVPAFKVPIPGAVHFLADFDDDAGIRIQCAHGNALDIAEWVRSSDETLDGARVREDLHGVTTSPVDVSQLGQYVIDPTARRLTRGQRLSDDALWGIALYAGRGVPAWDRPPERLRYSYWFACGLWPESYTRFVRDLYAELPGRVIPLADVDRLVQAGGMPPALVCVDLEGFALHDRYFFPPGHVLSSPQFIPDPARPGDDRGGWISTIVWRGDQSWLWLFDAADLARGPLCRLAIPAALGFSLHSAWLPYVGPIPTEPPAAEPEPSAADLVAALEGRLARLTTRARWRLRPLLAALRRL